MDEVITENPRKSATGFRLVFGYSFYFLAVIGLLILLPLGMLIFYPSEWDCYLCFLVPGLSSLVIGLVGAVALLSKMEKGRLGKHQDSVLLVTIWLLVVLVSAFPYFLADKFNPTQTGMSVTYSEAVFESVSGYATIGLTVTTDFLDSATPYCPHVFQFYRAFTQLIGGVGLVLVVASAVSDRHGLNLFYTEGHNDRLLPNLAKTARWMFGMYLVIIALGSLGLWLFGVPFFDAFCLSTCSMATGGFSPVSGGFAYYASSVYAGNGIFPYLPVGAEIVCCLIMLAGASSFIILYRLFTFKWKKFIRDSEVRFAGGFLILLIVLGTIFVAAQYNDGISQGLSFWTSFRYSAFQMISCLTTTGLSNVPDIVFLGKGVIFLSLIAMIIGGCAGSTAGGIKQQRMVIILKSLWWSAKYKLSPSSEVRSHTYWRAGQKIEIDEDVFKEAALYAVLFVGVILVSTLVICFLPDVEIIEGLYLSSSALTSAGNTIFDILAYKGGHAIYQYNTMLWTLSIAMFLGRLEIMPVYFAVIRTGKDIARKETV